MEDPGSYLLKIVQGAVAGQATRVEVRLGRRQVEIAFDSPEMSAVRPQRIADLLGSSLPVEEEALGEVLAGLRAARSMAPGSVTWTTGQGRLLVTRDDCRLEAGESLPESRCRFLLKQPARPLASIARRASEHRLAYTRCRFAPVAVVLDGRPVNDPVLDPLAGEGSLAEVLAADYPRGWLLAERYLVPRNFGPDLLAAPGPICRRARVYRLSTVESTRFGTLSERGFHGLMYEAMRAWDFPGSNLHAKESHPALRFQIPTDPQDRDARPLACVAAIGIPLALEGQSRVIAVRNGVTLDSRPADLGCPGAVAVLSGRGLRVQPGTLRVMQDAAWEHWLEFLRAQVQAMLTGVLANLMLLEQTDPELVRYIRRRLG
ncbi:MAG: hypothetical protein AMXMBFR33_63320 [Candidatus Xenobia bacterium]